MLIWIEIGVAAAVMLVLYGATFLFKPDHMAPSIAHVRIGAAIQGAILGALVGFVLVPLRLAFFGGDGPPAVPSPSVALAVLPILIVFVMVRRGLLARAPVIGRFLRAYRRATLRWQISNAEKALARIDNIEQRAGQ